MCEYPNPGNVDIHFHAHDSNPTLYVNKVFAIDISGGTIEYDGYFHIENHPLPLMYSMSISQTEPQPYKVENGCSYYKCVFSHVYLIEIYRKEEFESTNQYSDEVDEDGEPMRICFFPTNRERIWFKVLHFVDRKEEEEPEESQQWKAFLEQLQSHSLTKSEEN